MLRLFRWIGLFAVLCLLALMIGPFQGEERHLGLSDKPAHALAFAVITAALLLNWVGASRLQALGVAFLIGVAVEVAQGALGRDAEVGDLVADAVGIAITALLWPGRRML